MTVKDLRELLNILEDDTEVFFYGGISVRPVYEYAVLQPTSVKDAGSSLILFESKEDHDDYVNSETVAGRFQ